MRVKNGFRSSAPHTARLAAAGAQHPARLGEGRGRLAHQHVAEAAEHGVDRVVGELDPLGIDQAVVDVLDAPLRSARLRGGEHRRREVGGDQPAVLA